MEYTDSENASRCMEILVEAVGIIDAQRFIAYMNRVSGDYTVARRAIFDDMTVDDVFKMAEEDAEDNPFE